MKVDKLTDALSEIQTQTRKGFKAISQQISQQDSKFEAAFGELKVQVDQNSSELKYLKADSMEPIRMYTAGAGSGRSGQTLNRL